MQRSAPPEFVCAVCAARVGIAEALVWRCPNTTDHDRHHALQLVGGESSVARTGGVNPFLAFRSSLAWDAFAAANGMDELVRNALIAELDAEIAAVDGTGFHITPFERADRLSDALGFTADGGVWVKDDTRQVGGSHKARHLFGILLHLVAAERLGLAPWRGIGDRPPLAIASCGNAAIAAATLAAAAQWPVQVFVPPWADVAVTDRLGSLGAAIQVCPRLTSDPPGDPCVHRFREHVAAGAVPFSVQGTENVWCLDGGRTIGWEMATQFDHDVPGATLDRLFVQVGGGALAAGAAAGLTMGGESPRLEVVQTASCAPLVRAWEASSSASHRQPGQHWDEWMWPWEQVGESAADGILDDETYDWIPVIDSLAGSGGDAIVCTEDDVVDAHRIGRETTGIDVSATGTAGLAGVLASREGIGAGERIAVVFSGVRR